MGAACTAHKPQGYCCRGKGIEFNIHITQTVFHCYSIYAPFSSLNHLHMFAILLTTQPSPLVDLGVIS